ncbi:MAG: peptide ABC transporter substrate-binding protein [Lachnospiraceae bacterium]|nr:peptide ABC transporter substrate-binding protein [Lachnospiraceae bacterium]
MKKKLVSVLLVACMALSLTACGGNNKKDNAANNTNTEKTDGADDASGSDAGNAGESNEGGSVTNSDTNVLYINLASEPKYLDPALSSTVDGGCLAVNTFAGLYTYDEEGKLIPDLATAMPEVSEDGTVYTVKIKESKWSNGDDLKAQDFIYSWNRAIAQETAADYAYLFDIIARKDDGTLSVEATDDYTLVITLISPCPYFNDLMAFPTFLPVHQASVEAADPDKTNPGKWAEEPGFVCNGAYTLESWNHNESMVYKKNANYHDAANVTMEELQFMLSADDTAIYAAYNSGNVDYIDTVPNDEISSLNGTNPEFGILDNLGTYYIGFNVNDPVFDGKTVEEAAKMRQAMNLLIDRQFIVENIGQSGQVPADTFVPLGMADGNGGEFKGDTSYYDATSTGAAMVEDAKKLMEEAGYSFTDNGDGTYKIDPAINMVYLTNEGTGHVAIAQAVQQDLALLGIGLEIQTQDWNVFLENRKQGSFTIAREGWLADYNDPVNMLEIFTSDSGNNDMQLGKGDKSDSAPDWKEYDALVSEIRNTADFAKRVDLMHKAEDMLMETWAVVPLYYYNDIYMQKPNVEGIRATVFGMKYFMYATKK